MNDAIRHLETDLAAAQQRVALIERALAGLRELYGGAPAAPTPPKAAAPPTPRRAAAPPTNGAARAEAGDRLVAALQQKSPQKPGDLLRASGLRFASEGAYRNMLASLAKAGRIVRSGSGRGAIVALPGKPAKERL